MNILKYVIFIYFYLKGVLRFRNKDYCCAKSYFEKSMRYTDSFSNGLLCQYYGQTLLALNNIEESFTYLSAAYKIYNSKNWSVTNNEELKLTKDTLNALQYLCDNFDLKTEDFSVNHKIRIV